MLNKWDHNSKKDKDVMAKGLEIQKLQKFVNKLYVKETSGFNKSGLDECFDWMAKNVTTSSTTNV